MSPERLYLETKWASLISFELAAHLLKDTLPVAETVNAASVRNHLHRVGERAEAALCDEKVSFKLSPSLRTSLLLGTIDARRAVALQRSYLMVFFSLQLIARR